MMRRVGQVWQEQSRARAEILVRSGFGYSVQWSEVIERPERRGGGDLYVTVSAVAQRGEPGRIQ